MPLAAIVKLTNICLIGGNWFSELHQRHNGDLSYEESWLGKEVCGRGGPDLRLFLH